MLPLASGLAGARSSEPPRLRLEASSDRTAFRRWLAFLAESRYYAHKPLREVSDGDSLLRWAMRQALLPHDAAWSRRVELPVLPAMPSVNARGSCPQDPSPVLVSRDLTDALPGDLLLYRNEERAAHLMIYIGHSQVVHTPDDWVIYLTGGAVHRVKTARLMADPSPDWRPVAENPEFRGVWRLDLLSGK